MSRNRVRRSFTVETKARGRQAPAFLPVRAPLLDSAPERPADRLFEAAPAARAERPEPRRVLPSLIAPPVAEPEPVRVAEPRLPRVRRVAARAAAAATAEAESPARAPRTGAAAAVPAPRTAALALTSPEAAPPSTRPAERASRRLPREGETLRLGERWKRRLPRVCW